MILCLKLMKNNVIITLDKSKKQNKGYANYINQYCNKFVLFGFRKELS